MKLKDLVSVVKNSNNKQINFNLKKKKIRSLGMSEDDLLNITIDKKISRFL